MTRQITLVEDAVELGGHRFPFYLELQQIELGAAGSVDYFYMPLGPLRGNDPNCPVSNFRSCLEHFRCLIEAAGHGDDWGQQLDHLLASSYELLRTDRAVQRIYRDAFLRPRSITPEDLALPHDVRERIKKVVASRDKETVRQEMERALEGTQLSREDQVASSTAMDHWLNAGVERFRSEGQDGLRDWLNEVNEWYKRYRKRSDPRVQTFLRVFAYEAKTSFYHKYANFWISLRPWLEEHYGLDATSKRFLSIWHNQNQRVEIHHGCMPSGIVVPTGRQLWLPDSVSIDPIFGGRLTDHGTVEVVPDVFCGQILALHPLNWILLNRTELCELVGNCIASRRFDEALGSGRVSDFEEYWGMVEAVLTAANLYRIAHDGYEQGRRTRPLAGTNIAVADVPSAQGPVTEESRLRDYVAEADKKCPCGGNYEFASTEIPVADGQSVAIPVVCSLCGLPSKLEATQQKMEAYFELKRQRKRRPPR